MQARKESYLLKGKKYIVIIDVNMPDTIPKWFTNWEKTNSETPPQWFVSWTTAFEKKNDERWEEQTIFNKNQENFNKNITKDIKEIKHDIKAMKNTPTMKCELSQ